MTVIRTSKDRVSDGDLAGLIKGFRGLLALRDQEDDNILAALVELQERRSSETPRSLTNEEVRTLFSPLSAEEAEGFRQSGVGYPDETLSVGNPVTYTPRYASQLPRDGWTIDRLPPEPTYVIRHPSGTVIAVAAGEIGAAQKANQQRAPEVCGCPYGNCTCDDGSSSEVK